jgi:ligand-binding sensor domain-containing protein
MDAKDDSLIQYGKNIIHALPVIVPEQNVTYSLSLTDKSIWVNSWSSCLRKSIDFGKTFKRVLLPPDNLNSIKPSDTLNFMLDPRTERPTGNYNHLGFSVLAIDENEIWAGTAGGVNKSTDGGISWVKYNFKNQDSAISGNWVIAIRQQKYKLINRIWLATWKTDKVNEEFGASFTENGGKTWKVVLKGRKVNNFAFKDSIIYIAGNDGIYRSDDNMKTFQLFDNIVDPESRYRITNNSIYSIDVKNDTVWIGTGDGLCYTLDNAQQGFGSKWKILRAYQSIEANKSYAYPNPFSPDDEVIRIHYKMPNNNSKVTIEIFDFGMNLIRRVISNVVRSGNLEQEEIWNGRDEFSNRTPNGTYFYRVKMDDQYSWGKIIVLQ